MKTQRINVRAAQAGRILELWFALHAADTALKEVRKHATPVALRKTKRSYAAFQSASKDYLGPQTAHKRK